MAAIQHKTYLWQYFATQNDDCLLRELRARQLDVRLRLGAEILQRARDLGVADAQQHFDGGVLCARRRRCGQQLRVGLKVMQSFNKGNSVLLNRATNRQAPVKAVDRAHQHR